MTSAPSGLFRTLALNLLLALLYLGLGVVTFKVSVQDGNVTSVVFASEGVALAFSILFGPKIAPGIVIGQTLLSNWSGPSLIGGMGIGLVNACEGVLGGWLFRRWRLSTQLDRPRDVALLAAMIVLILQPISATGGTLMLFLNGLFAADMSNLFVEGWAVQGIQQPLDSAASLVPAWLQWWMGNAHGQLLIAPLLLVWLAPEKRRVPPLHGYEWLIGAIGLCGVVLIANSRLSASPLLLLTLSYTMLAWIGLRCDIRMITVTNLAVTVLVVSMALLGGGFMSHLPVGDSMFYVSFFLAIGALFSMLLFALFQERRDMIHRLTELASIDELTQVSSRRHFIAEAEGQLLLSRRYKTPICLAMMDIDHFKKINDGHGHETGDEVLRIIGRSCRTVLRSGDRVGRMGGEEFALLFPHSNAHEAKKAMQRLLKLVAQEVVTAPGGTEVRVTFSAGIAACNGRSTLKELIRQADQALYRAKNEGRNQVVMAEAASGTLLANSTPKPDPA